MSTFTFNFIFIFIFTITFTFHFHFLLSLSLFTFHFSIFTFTTSLKAVDRERVLRVAGARMTSGWCPPAVGTRIDEQSFWRVTPQPTSSGHQAPSQLSTSYSSGQNNSCRPQKKRLQSQESYPAYKKTDVMHVKTVLPMVILKFIISTPNFTKFLNP